MTRLSPTSQDALCTFSVNAISYGGTLIGAAHAAFYMEGQVGRTGLLHQIARVKNSLAILNTEAKKLDAVIDELEGRAPVVKVDEQEAA